MMDADNDGEVDNDLTARRSRREEFSTVPGADTLMLVMADAFVPGSGKSTTLNFDGFQLDSDNDDGRRSDHPGLHKPGHL